MDRLPTQQELRFWQERKDLHEQLVAVIRGLSTKLNSPYGPSNLRTYINHLQPSLIQDTSVLCCVSPKGRIGVLKNMTHCLFAEVSYVVLAFWKFIAGKNGFRKYTKVTREGIERLKWLWDNWENLVVSGNLKDGYELVEKR